MKKIAFLTLGCKVNQYEADSLASLFEGLGYQISEKPEADTDVVVLSTCAVTNEAERKSRQMISKIAKLAPNAKILVCGCASQNNPKNFEGKQNTFAVVGTSGKEWLAEMLNQKGNFVVEPSPDYEEMQAPKKHRTRSYLKIQDGCNNFCSYCLIPYIRGRSRSRSLESIIIEAFNMAKTSKEIVLTGIDLSSWGEDIKSDMICLVDSLKTIRARIRFSSMEAKIITPEFLTALSQMPNFCPHFHLSMQSGADKTLKDMNRHYTSAEFLQKVEMIKNIFPNAGITTDLIVGFPTETDDDFEQTLQTIKEAQFAFIHIFPYSKRNGTVASRYPLLPAEVVKTRQERVTNLRDALAKDFLQNQIGLTHEVLLEQDFGNDYISGHSENFTKVYVKKSKDLQSGDLVQAKIVDLFEDGVLAEVILKY